jgi:hypothetical protein
MHGYTGSDSNGREVHSHPTSGLMETSCCTVLGRPQAPWLYVIESDYVFLKPLELPAPTDPKTHGWGYLFNYIDPMAHKVRGAVCCAARTLEA